jgi:hypothetical protein
MNGMRMMKRNARKVETILLGRKEKKGGKKSLCCFHAV